MKFNCLIFAVLEVIDDLIDVICQDEAIEAAGLDAQDAERGKHLFFLVLFILNQSEAREGVPGSNIIYCFISIDSLWSMCISGSILNGKYVLFWWFLSKGLLCGGSAMWGRCTCSCLITIPPLNRKLVGTSCIPFRPISTELCENMVPCRRCLSRWHRNDPFAELSILHGLRESY